MRLRKNRALCLPHHCFSVPLLCLEQLFVSDMSSEEKLQLAEDWSCSLGKPQGLSLSQCVPPGYWFNRLNALPLCLISSPWQCLLACLPCLFPIPLPQHERLEPPLHCLAHSTSAWRLVFAFPTRRLAADNARTPCPVSWVLGRCCNLCIPLFNCRGDGCIC